MGHRYCEAIRSANRGLPKILRECYKSVWFFYFEEVQVWRVSVKPELLRWAYERADLRHKDLIKRFPKLRAWESGDVKPTLKQLEDFADATYAPIGYFFLDSPPEEQIPIPDLRTIGNREISKPSLNLIDTIRLCQLQQDWYQDHIRSEGYKRLEYVGSANLRHSVEKTAERMRKVLKFDLGTRRKLSTWEDALRLFRKQVDQAGIMVMINGVVGNNNKRKLNVDEFRGFALSDDFAPLIFINGQDSKSAQMFTLAHELAHIWLGKSAISNVSLDSNPDQRVEVWCNKVAAEFLVPLNSIKREDIGKNPLQNVQKLMRSYKVSSLVIIRRLFDAGYINQSKFEKAYKNEFIKIKNPIKSSGGDFYRTIEVRNNKKFIRNLIASTYEGKTLFTEAFRLLGITNIKTFEAIKKKVWE